MVTGILQYFSPEIRARTVAELAPDKREALQTIGVTVCGRAYKWHPWLTVTQALLQIEADAGDAWGIAERRAVRRAAAGSADAPEWRFVFDARLPVATSRRAALAELARRLDPKLQTADDARAEKHGARWREFRAVRVGFEHRTAVAHRLISDAIGPLLELNAPTPAAPLNLET